ncbi:MAG: hypothetical protein PHD04_00870 [Candidatus Pacebacteria bacterium]|nr:hypothetical protein [Candidatus Paceibacterota bacterium]
MYDYLYLLDSDHAVTTADYSTTEVYFGRDNPNVGKSGMFGLHVIITTSFGNMTEGMDIQICSDSTASATTVIASRHLAVAEMTAGKHFYIPAPPSIAGYCRARWNVTSTAANAGKLTGYFGEPGQGAD